MSTARLEPIGKIDINMLAALQLILSERSVGKAAVEIGLSQPAMSNSLARMRVAFDDPLLVRAHGKMELTSRGEQLLDQLNSLLPQIERLARPAEFDPASADIQFRVTGTDHAVQVLGPLIIAELSRQAPRTTIIMTTVQNHELELEDGMEPSDLRLGWFVSPPPSWYIRGLLVDQMVIVASAANPDIGEEIGAEQFCTHPQIGIRMRQLLDQTRMDKMLEELNLRRNVTVWLSNFSAIPHILRRSNLIALVPMSLAERYKAQGGIRIIAPPAKLNDFGVSMAWSPTVHHDPSNRWLRSLVVHCAQSGGI